MEAYYFAKTMGNLKTRRKSHLKPENGLKGMVSTGQLIGPEDVVDSYIAYKQR
jgi:hypothetical protein